MLPPAICMYMGDHVVKGLEVKGQIGLTVMDVEAADPCGPLPRGCHQMHTERSFALHHRPVEVNLLGAGCEAHKHWMSKRILMSGIDLPEVPLAIGTDNPFHGAELGGFSFFVCVIGGSWEDEHSGLHLVLMRMPELLFFRAERVVYQCC